MARKNKWLTEMFSMSLTVRDILKGMSYETTFYSNPGILTIDTMLDQEKVVAASFSYPNGDHLGFTTISIRWTTDNKILWEYTEDFFEVKKHSVAETFALLCYLLYLIYRETGHQEQSEQFHARYLLQQAYLESHSP